MANRIRVQASAWSPIGPRQEEGIDIGELKVRSRGTGYSGVWHNLKTYAERVDARLRIYSSQSVPSSIWEAI